MINQWFFTPDEVLSSPSILDGLSPTEERLRRAKGVNFIYQAGVLLELPQTTLYVAGVFFHRFYMRCSMVEEKHGIHHYVSSVSNARQAPFGSHLLDRMDLVHEGRAVFASGGRDLRRSLHDLGSSLMATMEQNIAATALFLANKTEENCRKTKDIIIAVAKVAQKNVKLIVDEQSKEYWRWRDSILMYEEVMLENLTFDLMVDNPHIKLYELLGQLNVINNKGLRHAAWAFCNDSCLTPLPLLMDARDIAIASIFFSSTFTNDRLDDINGEAWWKSLNANEEHCVRAIKVLAEFYTENPLRKQENPYQASPKFDFENTRRKADDSSANVTPRTDPDRGTTQSPPRPNIKVNGTAAVADTDTHSKDADSETVAAESASKAAPGDSDVALKEAANNPGVHQTTSAANEENAAGSTQANGKRKEVESLGSAEKGPDQKRRRVDGSPTADGDDDDEGEVHE